MTSPSIRRRDPNKAIERRVQIDLAFSSPGHPGNLLLPKQVADAVRELEGITECTVRLVNAPPWRLDRISDYARVNMTVVGS